MVLVVVEYFIFLYCVLVCNNYCVLQVRRGRGSSEVFVFCLLVCGFCLFVLLICLCPHHHKQISEASNRKYTYRITETERQQRGICFFVCYRIVLVVVIYFILLYCVLVCNSYCVFCRFGEGAGAVKCLYFVCSCVVFVCLFC